MVSKRNKTFLLLALIGLVALLSGCTQVNEPIDSSSTGFWNTVFVWPLSVVITYIADLFSGSYGWAIIIVTLVVRLLLVPLNVKQLKSTKAMQDIQPLIKERSEEHTSELQSRGHLGCRPLLEKKKKRRTTSPASHK